MKPTPSKTLALPIVAGLCCAIPLDAVYAQRAPQPAPPLALGDCAPATGAFVIAGTDTCLRIGGHLAVASAMRLGAQHLTLAEPSAQPWAVRSGHDPSRTAARATFALDARTPTELGPVRVYVSVRTLRGHAP